MATLTFTGLLIRIGPSGSLVTPRSYHFLLGGTCRGYASRSQRELIASTSQSKRQNFQVNISKEAPSPTAKKTSQSTSPKKLKANPTPAKVPAKATVTTTPVSSQEKRPVAAPADKKVKAEESTFEDQMAEIEALMDAARLSPTLDPWGHKIETLDVEIPYPINLNPLHKQDWFATWKHLKFNINNNLKNAASMYRLAAANSFPEIDLPRPTFFTKLFKWPTRIFKCASIKPDEWIAPFRHIALETYISVSKAVAAKDEKTIKRLTSSSYQDSMIRLVKQTARRNEITIWKFLGEESPVRVVSIRAMDGYLGKDEPNIGNRLLVQALVRFDTKQSMQHFTKQGQRLDGSAETRIVEYLVLEKRMWYNSPWIVRDQIFRPSAK